MAELHSHCWRVGPQFGRAGWLQQGHCAMREKSMFKQPIAWACVVATCVLFVEVSVAQQKSELAVPSVHGVALDSPELERLSNDALNGSGEAARKISIHYLVAQGNRKEGLFWALIAAENGDVIGQYNAGFLLKDDPDPRNKVRALYWLRLAADNGNEAAKDLLREVKER